MGLSTSGRTWEEASAPDAVRLARRFERAWRESSGRRPLPDDFLREADRDEPGNWLALLRTDLALRWEAGERVGPEWYLERYPDLGDEILVALIYEEFCLREELHETPTREEYLARFPAVAARFRKVLDIHGLVGTGETTAAYPAGGSDIPFPEAGQTIAGFHLVEELGRGAFARVFRAEERQLADRPVALKVARAGSREPQTLARLQHTHIVPIHSTRTDPATGLHLLCMPYFGRVTLARLLADPLVRVARGGAELVAALDRLAAPEPPPSGRSAGRLALARRTYAQAIAWWGAQMAEALEHAHERGVLHRDIKPSNVLVTADGMPMLLDFNLAREAVADDTEVEPALGGTLDYMAPEHLEALADGLADRVDGRADLYGLGVLLYESLMGARPFPASRGAKSATELLLRAAEERRVAAPLLRATHPEVPAALEAVVRRCLAPDPEERYGSAADLAVDLRAVADDLPLRFAREPLPGRVVRWVRRNRRTLAMAAPIAAALGLIGLTLVNRRFDRINQDAQAQKALAEGRVHFDHDEFTAAKAKFGMAETLAERNPWLERVGREAHVLLVAADETEGMRHLADDFFARAEPLQFHLLGFGEGSIAEADELLSTSARELMEILKPFQVFAKDGSDWTQGLNMKLLDGPRRRRLVREVDRLLFMLAIAQDRSGRRDQVEEAVGVCDLALRFAGSRGPWLALRDRLVGRLAGVGTVPGSDAAGLASTEPSALACLQWGLLLKQEGPGHLDRAIEWLRQAVRIAPDDYWNQCILAYLEDTARHTEQALRHYTAAVAIKPDSPWVRFNRARCARPLQDWDPVLDDLRRAAAGFQGREARWAHFEIGFARQQRGELAEARAEYARVIAANAHDDLGRAARLNQALLEDSIGGAGRALAEYDSLLSENADDKTARQSRAMLLLRLGRADAAEDDLDVLVRQTSGQNAKSLALRALARLAQGRAAEAEPDAVAAQRLDPTPGHRRLWIRTLLALDRVDSLPLVSPDDLAALPVAGASLGNDLRAAADRLNSVVADSPEARLRTLLDRAALLSALRDSEAESEADRAVALAPLSPEVYLLRAWIRQRRGSTISALRDTKRGLRLQPENIQLLILQGTLKTEMGDPRGGLGDLERAGRLGAGGRIHGPKAAAWFALGDSAQAVRDWTRALIEDPEDPVAYVGRARAFLDLQRPSDALADLEEAADWSSDRPALGVRIALLSIRSLLIRPDQLVRVVALNHRACTTLRRMAAAPTPSLRQAGGSR